jgi:hypothetical protein
VQVRRVTSVPLCGMGAVAFDTAVEGYGMPARRQRTVRESTRLGRSVSDNAGDLNGSTQHHARTRLALKTKAKIAY